MERVCKNCLLFNKEEQVCRVNIIVNGEYYELPVYPYDECHWERADREIQEEFQETSQLTKDKYFKAKLDQESDRNIEIKQVRLWSDGVNGYIERPEDI